MTQTSYNRIRARTHSRYRIRAHKTCRHVRAIGTAVPAPARKGWEAKATLQSAPHKPRQRGRSAAGGVRHAHDGSLLASWPAAALQRWWTWSGTSIVAETVGEQRSSKCSVGTNPSAPTWRRQSCCPHVCDLRPSGFCMRILQPRVLGGESCRPHF